jgi:hypothetical protein
MEVINSTHNEKVHVVNARKKRLCECDTLMFKGRIWPFHHKPSIVEVASKWRRWEP